MEELDEAVVLRELVKMKKNGTNCIYLKNKYEDKIIKIMSDICSLEEKEISNNNPLVLTLKKKIDAYENLFGESIYTKLLIADFTFNDTIKRIQLLREASLLTYNNRGNTDDIIISINELERDLVDGGKLDDKFPNELKMLKLEILERLDKKSLQSEE